MFGYVKKNEVIVLLESELSVVKRQMGISSKLAAMADDEEAKARYWNLNEEYQIRYDQTLRILNKLKRII